MVHCTIEPAGIICSTAYPDRGARRKRSAETLRLMGNLLSGEKN
jgi:hypothetical protein